MITKAILPIIVSAATGACALGQPQPPEFKPTALTIVLDTSGSCDRYEDDFRALARQAISVLAPGDYLEIIAARPSQPTIKLTHTIRKGDPAELMSIDAVLGKIKAQWLTNASIATALKMAGERLDTLCSKKLIARVIVMVLSNGHLTNHQAQRVLTMADRFRDKGWPLYFTGDRRSAGDLLVAAQKGHLKWELISEANPGLWLARREHSDAGADRRESLVSSQDPPPTSQQPLGPLAAPHRAQLPTTPGYNIATRIDTVTTVGPVAQSPAGEIPASPQDAVLEPNERPQLPPELPAVERPAEITKAPENRSWAWLRSVPGALWLWALLAIVILTSVTVVAFKSTQRAHKYEARRRANLKSATRSDPKDLVATYNGREYFLGRADSFHIANIGHGVGNTVSLPDDSLGDPHVQITRNGADFFLKNRAKSPVIVGASQVRPRRKHRLVLPCDIRLNDKTRLRLRLARQKINSPQKRSTNDDVEQPHENLAEAFAAHGSDSGNRGQ